jgi:hypothetical protein
MLYVQTYTHSGEQIMNKYEKLIEHIINDNDKAARELFHQIVVSKSRDIYESLMDEEVGGNQADEFVSGISSEVEEDEQGLGEDDEAMGDIELGDESDDMEDDEMSDDDSEFDDEEFDDEDDFDDEGHDSEEGEADVEDRVMDLETELEQLKAEFDKLLAGEEHEEEEFPGIHGEDDPDTEMAQDHAEEEGSDFDAEEMEDESAMMESENPFAKKGEKKANKKAKEESKEPKGQAEIMKEYVNKVKEFYKSGDDAEGKTVGTGGDEPTVNKKAVSLDKGPDFGGESANIVRGGANESPDGKPFKKPTNVYSKGEKEQPLATKDGGYKNKLGGNKPWNSKGPADGHGAEKKGTESGKTVGTGGDKPSLNDKGLLGGSGQPTGKKK